MTPKLNEHAEGYLDGIEDPKRRANVRNALGREMTLNGQSRMTRADHAVRLYGKGYRAQLDRKGNVRLVAPNGSFFAERDVTKALCDFVVYLTHGPSPLGYTAQQGEIRYIATMQRDTRLD
jgi:hypothetical protein